MELPSQGLSLLYVNELARVIAATGDITIERASADAAAIVRFVAEGGEPFAQHKAAELAAARAAGTPLGHVLGFRDFLGLRFVTTTDVLVPHPCTEILTLLCGHIIERDDLDPRIGCEVGVGCGAVSISLLSRYENLVMLASEVSDAARAVAADNASRLLGAGHERLRLFSVQALDHVIEPFTEIGVSDFSVDLIVSNPPYLLSDDDISAEYRDHMPDISLYAPNGDALLFYREIAKWAPQVLSTTGFVALETRTARVHDVARLFAANGLEVSVWDKAAVDHTVNLDELHPLDRSRPFRNHSYLIAHRPEARA